MKKIWKSILAITCTAMMFANLAACEKKEIISAYDIAVENGFQGTEEEWLSSLKGSNGLDGSGLNIQDVYEAAKANGFEGSLLDFIKEYLDADVQEDNDTKTIADNMLSVVSIYCGFTKTVEAENWWEKAEEVKYSSAGSGVILDLNKEAGNATIVTNYHVLYDAECNTPNHISDSIYLYPYGAFNQYSTETNSDEKGDGIKARYVGGAMDYDIAVLKIEGSEFIRNNLITKAKIGNSEGVQAGEKVFAVGNPDGAGISVVSGVISVESEYIEMSSTSGVGTVSYRVMRTDAAINSGNSGGALFNARGELIGITNAKNVGSDVDNMCYALPMAQVKNLYKNILDNGGVLQRAMLGVMAEKISSKPVMVNGKLTVEEEIIVSSAEIATTAAAYNKLHFGDKFISITIGGETVAITKLHHVNDQLLKVRKGDTITIKVLRDNQEVDVQITYNNDLYFTMYN
ncbi:MAG: serine protease [Clostridiales bacterium]|nr:serine protease [Clostridiales bacterium]